MADAPKPLPRTKVRNQPVIVLTRENRISKSDEGVPVHKPRVRTNTEHLKTQIPPPRIKKLSPDLDANGEEKVRAHTVIGIEALSSSQVDFEDDLKSGEKQAENTEVVISENDNEGTTNESKRSEHSETHARTEEDDDELVVDELLRFKKNSLIKRKLLDEETDTITNPSSSETSANSSSPRSKVVNDNGNAEEFNEDLLGIHIHRTDCLKMDRIIKHPSVIVHIVDADTKGIYLSKSKPDKNVTYNQETSSFILPVMTRPFNFKEHKCIIAQWEETLTFNENTCYIIKPSTIFFFEVVDFIDSSNSDAEYSSIGWHRIAWAFLKPISTNNVRNIDNMLRLQLYQSDQKYKSINNKTSSNVPYVYNLYRKKRWKPYPSTLYVTVTTISSRKVDSKPQQRSCTPLQPEIGSDSSVKSLALVSNGDDSLDTKSPETLSAIYRLSNIEWSRLPGQSCRIPNVKIANLHPDSRGSLAVKFSHSGLFLACGTNTDVFIYAIDGVLERKLINHQGLIYTLSWFTDDSLLLSASADCTACIWDMKSFNENPLQILPHPSFVYCSTFIYPEQTIVTGCYDGMVRIWWHTHASSRLWQLHQELSGHEEYVCAVCSFKNKEFFSGDSCGSIIHWAIDESARWFKLTKIRTLEIQNTIISKLVVFPGEKRLLIHTRDSLLRTMDIKSTAIIQWYQGGLNETSQCNSVVSPCGSLVFASSEDGTVNVWESNTAKHLAFYSSGNVGSGCGGTVDYHPLDHICAFSSYSAGSGTSSVNLLKYSPNSARSSDVMLYMLNGFSSSQYESSSVRKKNFNVEAHTFKKNKMKNNDMNNKSFKIKK